MLGGMPQPASLFGRGVRIPVVIDTYASWSNADQTNLSIPIPKRAKTAGIRFLYQITRPSDTPYAALAGGEMHGFIKRVSVGAGSSYTTGLYSKVLDGTDIAAGALVIPAISGNHGLIGLWLWNCNEITGAMVNAGAEVTTGFNRSADVLQNSIAGVSMTPTKPSLAVSSLTRGGGNRAVNVPAGGWSPRVFTATPQVLASQYAQRFATKPVRAGEATGTDAWTVDGTADMRLTTHTLLLAAA